MQLQGSTEPNYFQLLIQVADARIAARPPQLVPRHLAISTPTIRSHGGSRSSCTILPKIFMPVQTPANPLHTPGGMPRPRLQPRPFQELINVHPSGWPHYHSIQSTSLGHACRAFHHRACILNSPSHQLSGREPRRSFRPQMALWYSNPGLGNWLEDA